MNTTEAFANFQNVQCLFSLLASLHLTDHLYPEPASVQDGEEFDFIIVGGGTAGCVVASRLAEMKNVTVLLVEAGGNPTLESGYPAYFFYAKKSKVDWNITSAPDPILRYHRGGVADINQGKMLGGSSGLSYITYNRGNAKDYNEWADITKDQSWAFENVLPLFKQSEDMLDETILNSAKDKTLYGTEGHFKLSKYNYTILDDYYSAFKGIGTKSVIAVNNRNPLGVTSALFGDGGGQRQNTAYSFLRDQKHNPNLFVLTKTLVTKIIFDRHKNASGVIIRNKHNETISVKAKKEVIVSAGALKTPQLLMLSGIGPRKHLESKNVKVIADLPVGDNLQDHPYCVLAFKMGERTPISIPRNPNMLDIPVIDSYIALNKTQSYPDYEIIGLILDDLEVFLSLCGVAFSFTDAICDTILKGLDNKQLFFALSVLTYPDSRGNIRLNSTNINDQPLITLNYYNNNKDIENHVEGVVHFNSILNTTYFKSVEAEFIDPKLDTCAGLDKHSKEYWRCYCLGMVLSGQHFVGTCAMGTVVDSKLLVKEVTRLRIVDTSIMPKIIASPTIAAAIMIAQKGANMIIDEHDLK